MGSEDDKAMQTRRELAHFMTEHVVLAIDDDRVLCGAPRCGDWSFEVRRLPWRRLLVHGDINPVIFEGGDGVTLMDRVAWIAAGDIEFARSRAQRAMGPDFWEFDNRTFAEAVEAYRSEWLSEIGSEGDVDLSVEDTERFDAIANLVENLRSGELAPDEAWRAVHDLDMGMEYPAGMVYSLDLVKAHEAARCAFRLLQPGAALAAFADCPTVESLALYNRCVRGMRSRHVADAFEMFAREGRRRAEGE